MLGVPRRGAVEIWAPALDRPSGGNLYDRMLAEALRAQGFRVRMRESGWGAGGEAPGVVVQDGLLHREFGARNRRWGARRPRLVALVHHLMSDEPERSEAERRRLRESERDFLRSVDRVLAPSRASAGAAERLAGRALPGAVCPPGRDRIAGEPLPELPDEDEIRARAGGPLRAAFVGNLIPRKRLLELLDALAEAPEWKLTVVGREDLDPGYAARARERAAALGGRVRFAGSLPPLGIAGVLRESCLLAVPSTHEGFGIVYIEGFAFGLPALAAAAGGAPELVAADETGWLIPDGPPEDIARRLAGHLETLADDRGRLAAMGVRARERHRRHPTWAESFSGATEWLAGR